MRKYKVVQSAKFKRALKKAFKQHKDIALLNEIVGKLAQCIPLEEHHRDHPLKGDFVGARECHIEPDWLLVYRYIDDILVLSLMNIGSHSEIF